MSVEVGFVEIDIKPVIAITILVITLIATILFILKWIR